MMGGMDLWIVTNQWQGEGREGVIVQASDESAAVEAAREALLQEWSGQRPSEHQAQHLASLDPGSGLVWEAERITLPHVGEFV